MVFDNLEYSVRLIPGFLSCLRDNVRMLSDFANVIPLSHFKFLLTLFLEKFDGFTYRYFLCSFFPCNCLLFLILIVVRDWYCVCAAAGQSALTFYYVSFCRIGLVYIILSACLF